jgi:thymidylate kinase
MIAPLSAPRTTGAGNLEGEVMSSVVGAADREGVLLPDPHPLAGAAFAALSRAQVRWALVRGLDKLANPTGDLDILVHPDDLAKAAEVLRGAGFVEVDSRGHGVHRFFVGYQADEDRFLVIDIVTRLSFGPERVLDADAAEFCLARRTVSGTVARLAPGDEFWATLLHAVVSRGHVRERERPSLTAVANSGEVTGPLAASLLARGRVGQETLGRLRDAVGREDWAQVDAIGATLRARWLRREAATITIKVPVRRLVRRISPRRSTGASRGLTVALLGPDGAGKSTLTTSLSRSWPIPARTIYMGVFRTSDRERIWRKVPGLVLASKLARLRTRTTLAAFHRQRGRLVLFDRYTYDALLRPGRRSFRAQVSYSLLAKVCPPPDVVVVLDAPGEVMFTRKGEHTVEILEERRQRYLDMAERLPQSVVVDATQPPDVVARTVTQRLWGLFSAARTP